ncbi:MAG: response regulator [Gammaproteobacteria bacterium]
MTDTVNKPRILAVDDSRVMRRAISKILSQDYDVIEAEHGEDAWTLLQNDNTIQVVFTDLSMPYLDGYGLLQRIRESEDYRLQNMPVIIITGKEDDDDAKAEALEKGATDFISKPFESVQLKARAKAHVRYEEASRQLTLVTEKLEKQSAVDELTELGGQRYFCKAGSEKLDYLKRHDGQCVILRLDIDEFNKIFIKNGKAIADEIIKATGQILKNYVRNEDMAARVGLSKFAMMFQSTQLKEVHDIAERIRQHIMGERIQAGGKSFSVSVSIGLLEPQIEKDADIVTLVEQTEKVLQQSVDAGGGRISQLSTRKPDFDLGGTEDLSIDTMLEHLSRGETDRIEPFRELLLKKLHPLLDFLSKES